MSIHSSAFGSVILTGKDAEKFVNQVRYGRPKKAASETIQRGSELAKELLSSGKVTLTLEPKKSHAR